MKGLYQILAEDYREYQLKESIGKSGKKLIESSKSSNKRQTSLKEAILNKKKAIKESDEEVKEEVPTSEKAPVEEKPLTESCKDDKEKVIKGSEEETKEPINEDEKVEEEIEVSEEPVDAEDPTVDEMGEGVPEEKEPTAIDKISEVANLSKDEIEAELAEMTDEEKEAIKGKFEAIKNVAMELFPEEVEEDIEEITEEIPTEEIPEEPLEECEIKSFKVTRIAPKFGAVMIEAQTKDGLKYITGKNFNETEKTLDEAEIVSDKVSASNRFKSLLK